MRRVVEEGETFAQAAARANVSKSTLWEWVRRWRQATPGERESLEGHVERRWSAPTIGCGVTPAGSVAIWRPVLSRTAS